MRAGMAKAGFNVLAIDILESIFLLRPKYEYNVGVMCKHERNAVDCDTEVVGLHLYIVSRENCSPGEK